MEVNKPDPGESFETDDEPAIVCDALFFDVRAACDNPRHSGLGIRFFFDPDDDEDFEDILIPTNLVRPFLVGGFDAVCAMDDRRQKEG